MFEKICDFCGKPFQAKHSQARFCCKKCRGKYNNAKRIQIYEPFPCPHNDGVDCLKKECHRCGFNPKVAKTRLDKIKRAMGVRE